MLLVKGDKFMETYEAEVIEKDSEHYLSLDIQSNKLNVPLTKDEPNEVKKVFNELIVFLKQGLFSFSIEEKEDGDIFYHVAKEYIGQLNSELAGIYKELDDCDLLESKQSDTS